LLATGSHQWGRQMFGPILAALLATAQPAYSMQFSRVPIEDEKVFVFGKGPIIEGDSDRLRGFINNMPATDRIVGFSFDSPGGSILEAEEIAEMIHGTNSLVLIDSGSECLSACFLMFAASPRKAMAADALIGVHSASNRGQETVAAMASTTAMARVAASYDVPPIIIAKMVETKPGRMAWLTPEC
jgi:hypothetical protein